MNKYLILAAVVIALSPRIAIPLAEAQSSDGDPLDETQTWFISVHGNADSVTKMPELILDEKDKQSGTTSLAFETAGEGNPNLWLALRTRLKSAINLADYHLLTLSYKITPRVLDTSRPNAKEFMGITISKSGSATDFLESNQEVYLDGEWHTLEVPISSFKQPKALADTSPYEGQNATALDIKFTFLKAPSFDVEVKIDNIQLQFQN